MNNSETTLLSSIDEVNEFFDSDSGILFFHQNIRSLNTNFDNFLSYINNLITKPHIIILSEAWLQDMNELNLYNIVGYESFAAAGSVTRAGGVVIFVHSSITATKKDCCIADCDSLLLFCKYKNYLFNVLGLYRFHLGDRHTFIASFDRFLATTRSSDLYCLGDVNLNVSVSDVYSDSYLNCLNGNGMQQLIDIGTRVVGSSSTCIDHLSYRSNLFVIDKVAVIETLITDHRAVACILPIVIEKRRIQQSEFKKLDHKRLSTLLKYENWEPVFEEPETNKAFDIFYQILNNCIVESQKNIKYKQNIKMLKPWMTPGLSNAIYVRDKLHKMHKNDPNNLILKRKFVNMKDKIKVWVKEAKLLFYSSQLFIQKHNPREKWKTIKTLLPVKDNNKDTDIVLQENGILIDDNRLVSDVMNKYFIEMPKNLSDSFPALPTHIQAQSSESFRIKTSHKSIFFSPVTLVELKTFVDSLSTRKSSGDDVVTARILKDNFSSISSVLLYLFNLSLVSGCFPEILKSATVVPIFKKGNKLSKENYRPISLLPVMSKLFEKIIKTRLLSFLNSCNFFSACQFGFRENLCTEIALQHLLEYVYSGLNSGCSGKTAGIFLDISKAFDTVNHSLLFRKLESAGVRGIPLDWFKSFLQGRKQYVRIRNVASEVLPITCGVPQGSVLGPILFLIFVNDLYNGELNGRITAFADDTALSYKSNNLQDLHQKMQSDLNKISLWFTCNKLKINVAKTNYMMFSLSGSADLPAPLRFHSPVCSYSSCDCPSISPAKTIKYLGLSLDENLNWRQQIETLKKSLRFYLMIFHRIKYLCDFNVMKELYFSFVHSKIEYGITCWGSSYYANQDPIIKLQKAFIRLITGSRFDDHTFPLFCHLRILPVRFLYVFKVLSLFFNISGNRGVTIDYCQPVTALRQTRRTAASQVRCPKPNCTLFRKTFIFLAPRFYNALPLEVKNAIAACNCGNKIKRLIKIWLLSLTPEALEFLFIIIV